MFLLLNTPPGGPGSVLRGLTQGSGALNDSAADAVKAATRDAGADFSRVLAGKMDDSSEQPPEPERSLPVEGSQDGSRGIGDREVVTRHTHADQVAQGSGQSGEAGGESQTGAGFHQGPWGDQALATAPWLMSGLESLAPVLDLPGPINGWNFDSALPGGIHTGLRSQLAGDIAAHFTDRNGLQTITLKLNPERLGQVDVQLQAKDNHLSVRLQVSSRESEIALRENVKELADAIQKQTGKFQHVDVRVDLKQSDSLDRQAQDGRSGNAPDDDGHGQAPKEHGGHPDREDADSTDTDTETDPGMQGG